MQDIDKILNSLTPEKRALLELKLKSNPQEFNIFPLSFAQRRLWFLYQLEPESTAYNIPAAIKFKGNLNITALKQSIDNIVMRHEILRSKIVSLNENPYQLIDVNFKTYVDEVDLSNYNAQKRDKELKSEIDKRIATNFDLSKGPLFQITLIKLTDTENVLLIVMHHIISDGWSIGLFIKEFSTCYESYQQGKEPLLQEMEVQYFDFANWQQNWKNSEDYFKQLQRWKTKLNPLPETLSLPTDYKRPATRNQKGNTLSISLGGDIQEGLLELSHKSETSMFMLCLAAFNVFLYKYTGQEDITVGTPIANRQMPEIENLIGFFVNTLVIRSYIEPTSTFIDFLQDVKTESLNAFENQEIPFETLVEELHPQRNMSQTPLFQVMFAYQNKPSSSFNLRGLKVESYEIENTTSKFDLTLNLIESNTKGIILSIEYDRELYNKSTIDRFAESYKLILNQIINNPHKSIRDISVITLSDLELIKKFNETEYNIYKTENLVQLFERNLKSYENKLALVHESKTITYKRLNEKVNKLARYLLRKGIKKDSIVPIIFERSIESVIALLSVWKAGAAYLPIIPSYPKERIYQIIEDCNPKLIISNSPSIKFLNRQNFDIILIDEDREDIDMELSSDPILNIDPLNLAYVIYTSGSTGNPKGVMINHKSAVNLAFGLGLGVYGEEDTNLKVSLNAPLLFDASLQQILQLCFGHTIYLIPEETRLDTEKLLQYIRKNKIDVFDCVPTQLKFLIEEGLIKDNQWIPSKILPGGEAIDQITWRTISQVQNSKFFNMYGPTECTVDSTFCKVDKNILEPSIGKPIINVRHYVLDNDLQEIPIGIPGELFISGDCLSRGYFGKADLTAMKFIPDPFTNVPGSRMYSTGDKVKLRGDGNYEYLERVDDQIKLRGFRIELGEIDSTISQFDQIKQSVTILKNESSNISKIVSYCILNDGFKENSELIVSMLEKKLPDYMIPTDIVFLEKYPLLSNGKIDKKELSRLNFKYLRENEFIYPSTETEKKVAQIFSEVLQLEDKISINNNFFDLGGHSLLATKCISRIRNSFNVDLPLRTIFEKSDIIGIAQHIDKLMGENDRRSISKITKAKKSDRIPLSFAQRRLWFLDQLEPNSSVYNIPSAIKIKGDLNQDKFKESIYTIIKRHEILRTTIQNIEGEGYQKIHTEYEFNIKTIDLTGINRRNQENKYLELINGESSKPLALNCFPLFRMLLIKNSDEEFIFIVVFHHIVSDGWSINIFFNEILKLYASNEEGNPAELPALEIQYSDYSIWQKNWFNSKEIDKQSHYWTNHLANISPITNIPTDFPRPKVQTYNGSVETRKFDKDIFIEVNKISKKYDVTIFMIFMSVLKTMIFRMTGQHDLCIGTPIANRNRTEIEPLIGFFVNTLVIRSIIEGHQSFLNLLKDVKKNSLDAYDNQDIPFEKLVDLLKIERSVSYSPVFQVMFSYQNLPESKTNSPNLELEEIIVETKNAKFDLNVVISELDNKEFECAFEYNTDLFTANTIKSFIKYFNSVLESILENPEIPLKDIVLVDSKEMRRIKSLWNKNIADSKEFNPIHRVIEKQVIKNPHGIAIKSLNGIISYEELNRRANSISSLIIKKSGYNNKFIAVYMSRSIDMIVTILGILKSGSAYVPIDTNTPSERINFVLRDGDIKMIFVDNNDLNYLHNEIDLINTNTIDYNYYDNKNNHPYLHPLASAYMIYTSGSTGIPKGVSVSHSNLYSFIDWSKKSFNKEVFDGMLLSTSMSFDVSIFELFATLAFGGTVILADNVLSISDFKYSEEIKTISTVPSAIVELMRIDSIPNSTEYIHLAGEYLAESVVNEVYDHPQIKEVYDLYGPTENTVYSTYIKRLKNESSSIGRAINDVNTYILDEWLHPVPIGIVGELYLGGKSVATGYHKRPSLTAEKFLPDPFSPNNGDRMYRTGDLVRLRRDGNIEYISRIDHQVKVRGFRIELGEIEYTVNSHKPISNNIVLVKEDSENVKKLICYYTTQNNLSIDVSQLREYLTEKLPHYMIPSLFIQIEKIPHTTSGKVDRTKLPDPQYAENKLKKQYVKPRSQNELILAEVVEDVLKIKKVGINDNFFELGGDSILGIQVIAKLKKHGLTITPIQLFQYQTIHKLASVAKKTNLINAQQDLVIGDIKANPIQKAFLENNYHNHNHWNQSVLLKINKKVNKATILKSVKKLSEHHDALRLRVNNNSKELFLASDFDENVFEYIELPLDNIDPKSEIEQKCKQFQGSLDINNGPIFKVILFRIGGNESRLLIIVHHLAIDGVSWRILLEDFQLLLSQEENEDKVILPLKTSSIKEWGNELLSFAQSPKIEEEIEFWTNKKKYVSHTITVDNAEGQNSEESTKTYGVSLSQNHTRQLLTEINQKYNTRIDEILLTALVLSFSKITGKRSVMVYLEGHGRTHISDNIDLSRTIGWFTNIYPVFLDLKKSIEIEDSIKLVKEQIRETSNKGLGFGLLRHLNDKAEVREKMKAFDKYGITFNYLGQFDNILTEKSLFEPAEESTGPERDPNNERFSLLDIIISIYSERLRVKFAYSQNLFEDSTIVQFANEYINILKDIIDLGSRRKEKYLNKSDFNLANLDERKLNTLISKLKK